MPLDYEAIVDDLLSQEIDALIILEIPRPLFKRIQEQNIPIILLAEQVNCHELHCYHPRMASPFGLYKITQMLAEYVIQRLRGKSTVLVIGGMCQTDMGEDGRSKLASIYDSFAPYSSIEIRHISTSWRYDYAYPKIVKELQLQNIAPDAIFGLSDTLALAGRNAVEFLGLLKPKTIVVGYNGDPQALAAITRGTMEATVENPAFDFGSQAVELAVRAAAGQALPPHFSFNPCLITIENVAEVSAQKLVEIAELPNQLVGGLRQLSDNRTKIQIYWHDYS